MRNFTSAASLLEKTLSKLQNDGVRATARSIFQYLTFTGPAKALATKWGLLRNPIKHQGVILDMSHPEVTHQIPLVIYGHYEQEIASFVDRHLPRSIPVVEFGGGIGFVACYVDNHLNDDVPQFVIEPNPTIQGVLYRNLHLNDANAAVKERAYSFRDDVVDLMSAGDFTQATTQRDMESLTSVDTVSLEEINEWFSSEEFALIVDMEGAEAELIQEEFDLVCSTCPVIIIEYHEFDGIRRDVKQARQKLESEYELIEERGGGGIVKCVYRKAD